ncbi:LysR family transcriptional regulator [Kiloniella sp. EL199]|uniref:LysR family transcriptional regulator n=1 Tax=Kiloniella sp. EL199 TaxID=2107581 RepID=UPI000EA2F61E|nr:LysR family transcriptional regulator [Kiloniella sp. EL199]
MVKYTIKQCHYFAVVAEQGGIAQAARVLNISQPAIAQAIDKLEDITGLRLFDRHHAKGMSLTIAGRSFLLEVHDLLKHVQTIDKSTKNIASDLQGTIRLGCFQSIAPFHMARLARNYVKLMPKILIDAEEHLQEQLVHKLLDEQLDLAILYNLDLDPSELSWQVLDTPTPYILLPENHSLAGHRSLRLQDLADEPYVLFDAPGSREYFYTIFATHKINPQIAFRSTSLESVRSAVGHGLGFSILTMRPHSPQTYDGHLVVPVNIEGNIQPTQIVIAHKLAITIPDILLNFIDFCQSEFKLGTTKSM